MSFCPKCGTSLLESANFCPKCGYNLSERIQVPNEGPIITSHGVHNRRKNPGLIFAGLLLLLGMGLYFYYQQSFSITNESIETEVVGIYYDQSGTITGEINHPINVRILDGRLSGSSDNGVLNFDLAIKGPNQFEGAVTIKNIDAIHHVEYNPYQKRLIFFRDGSPLEWHIEK